MNQFWDRLGISASLICILHCLMTPILLVAMPVVGAYLSQGWFHALIGALVFPVAIWAFLNGYREHRQHRVLAFGALGLTLVFLALVQHHDQVREFLFMSLGGSLLTLAHYLNLRCCRIAHKPTPTRP